MACIDNLVVSGICDDTQSETGFILMQAAGMNVKNFANISSDSSGVDMVEEQKELTLLQIKNDFVGALQMSNVVTQMSNPVYNSSIFRPSTNIGSGTERGLVIRRVNSKGGLTKVKISKIELYPFADGEGYIKIVDNGVVTSWPVEFVANQVNTFSATQLSGFPYTLQSLTAQVLVVANGIEFASAEVICRTGCNGTVPNSCAYINGWDGSKEVKKESYGLNIYFGCECDYEQIICDSKAIFGELIWLKWQINIWLEQQRSNRFDNWVIYGREEAAEQLKYLESAYVAKWNNMIAGIFGVLKTYKDACLDCRSVRYVTNV